MQRLRDAVSHAQSVMARKLDDFIAARSLDEEAYARYLTMQYHLTKGVQRYFLTAAANPTFSGRKSFRRFLYDFANEEEQHFLVAANDLRSMGREVGDVPFDVELWHAYFERITKEQPFVRLGAACVLENLSDGPVRPRLARLLAAPFLDGNNTRFIVLHQHEVLPHGQQILAALEQIDPGPEEQLELELGAHRGALLYLRMTDWTLSIGEYAPLLSATQTPYAGVTMAQPAKKLWAVR